MSVENQQPEHRNEAGGGGVHRSSALARPTCLIARALVAIALTVTMSLARGADDEMHKYRFLSPGLHWSTATMTWYYAPAGQPSWANTTQMVALIQQAMNTWSSQCGVQFQFLGTTDVQATVQDGASIIGWLSDMNYSGNTSWYMRSGLMTEADIQLNVKANGAPASTYPVILHELGHAIGLDHSEVHESVMAGPPASPAYSYATSLTPDDVTACQTLYGPSKTPPIQVASVPAPSGVVAADASALEYYHPTLDHYFMTADPNEQASLARGGPDGQWRPTGVSFPVWKAAYANLQAMCRFYGDPSIDPATGTRRGPNSHFYTANPAECAVVTQKWPVWIFEGNAFYAALPDGSGSCPTGTQPVYRYFRPQGDPNHRYVTTDAGRAEMQSRGWVPEGVTWCAGR